MATRCKSCQINKTPYYSWRTGTLAKGCRLCVKGEKLVLFITGLCAQRCFYCPVSEHKWGKNDAYANEWKIANPSRPKELIKEARLTRARGAGITGGDPLMCVDRCASYIRLLKKTFGKKFHIHLYTPLKLVTTERLSKLAKAGLDEIRFHPDLDDNTFWPRLNLARAYSWDIGVEIPALPGYGAKTKKLIDFIADKVSFINLNELELSDTIASHYKMEGMFEAKDSISYGVKGSEKMALTMLKYAAKKGLSAHFCTARLKDKVQVGQRILRRAGSVALKTDVVTSEGTLIRGCAYLPDLAPGLDYRRRLQKANKKVAVALLNGFHKRLRKIIRGVKVDEARLRILMSQRDIKKNAGKLKTMGLKPAIVEEYPTADALQLDLRFL